MTRMGWDGMGWDGMGWDGWADTSTLGRRAANAVDGAPHEIEHPLQQNDGRLLVEAVLAVRVEEALVPPLMSHSPQCCV